MTAPAPSETKGLAVVVDDDANVLRLLKDIMHAAGFSVEPYASFAEAEARLAAGGSLDILITDVRLGTANGLHLVALAVAAVPDVVAVVLTGLDDRAMEQAATSAGAHFLVKPVRVEQLFRFAEMAAKKNR